LRDRAGVASFLLCACVRCQCLVSSYLCKRCPVVTFGHWRPAPPGARLLPLRLSVFAASLHPRNDRSFCSRVKGDALLGRVPLAGRPSGAVGEGARRTCPGPYTARPIPPARNPGRPARGTRPCIACAPLRRLLRCLFSGDGGKLLAADASRFGALSDSTGFVGYLWIPAAGPDARGHRCQLEPHTRPARHPQPVDGLYPCALWAHPAPGRTSRR